MDIINEELIPALDQVGKGFEKGTVFLPQLLMSADAAKIAFAVLKDELAKSGESEQAKDKVILATVKGDIHDIGKNIVKVLLENYSFEVVDLGKDVPPETIVDTVVAQQIRLVGLSALMTTTVVSMEETIRQLREKHRVQSNGRRRCPKSGICRYDRCRFLWKRCNAVRVLRTRTAAAIKSHRQRRKSKCPI